MSKAFCFDLDGTITSQEILPLLSKEVGLYEEFNALTAATIRGVIPFTNSFLLRCRLLNEIPISRVQTIVGHVGLNQEVVSFIAKNRQNSFVVTGNLDVWIAPLISRLGCRFFTSVANANGDSLLNVKHVINKGDVIKELRTKFSEIIAIGDGMGDVPMFEQADVRIAFGGVHNPIETLTQLSDYVVFHERSLCRLLNTL